MSWDNLINIFSILIAGFIVSALSIRILLPLTSKIGLSDNRVRTDIVDSPPALIGGPVIFFCFMSGISIFLVLNYNGYLATFSWQDFTMQVSFGLAVTFIFLIGIADDFRELPWKKKILGQVIAVLILLMGGHCPQSATLPLLGKIYFGYWGIPILMVGVVSVTNAINLLDGMDGWCGGVCFFAALTIGVVGMEKGDIFVGIAALSIAGALLGFILFNWPPAKIYLGDSGSLTLGFALGVFAFSPIMLHVGERSSITSLLLVTLIPLSVAFVDTSLAIGRRILRGHKLSIRDKDHLYHWMRRYLGSRKRTLIYLYMFCGAVSLSVIAATLSESSTVYWSAVGSCLLVLSIATAWVAKNYRIESIETMLANRQHFEILGNDLKRLENEIPEVACPFLLLESLGKGVDSWKFDSVKLENGNRHIKLWVNNNPRHVDRAREEICIPIDDEIPLKVKCLLPKHDLDSYDFYLRITWQFFVKKISCEFHTKCGFFRECLDSGRPNHACKLKTLPSHDLAGRQWWHQHPGDEWNDGGITPNKPSQPKIEPSEKRA